MADYYPVLKRAIGNLPTNSGESRRAVYEKARAALVNQLKSYDPPLSQAEITDQRLQLEESIRRVELEFAEVAFGLGDPSASLVGGTSEPVIAPPADAPSVAERVRPTVAEPAVRPRPQAPGPGSLEPRPPAPPAGGMEALKQARAEASNLGGATAQAVKSAREAIDEPEAPAPERVEPTVGREPPARRPVTAEEPVAPALRPRGRPARADRPVRNGGQSRTGLIAGVLVAVLLVAGGGYALTRPDVQALLGMGAAPEAPVVEEALAPEAVEPAETAAPANGLEPKILDRLPSDGEPMAPVAPDARTVQTERVVPPPETPAEPVPPVEAPPAPPPAAAETPAAPPAGEANGPAIAVAQRAILYEEPIPGSDGARVEGRVVWSYVNEPMLPGEPPQPQIRGMVEVPDRGMTLLLSIRKNLDSALPASHIVELKFDLPADFSGRGIDTTPGLILKQTEEARGDPLIGAVAKVADNLFWLALSGTEADTSRNVALLRERQWVDVPIRYGNRRRAILTFEKGTPGEQVFNQAFAAWPQ